MVARKPTPGARERILEKAGELFAERGINSVGIQEVVDECGCGKNLLYREFHSKDELVVAYLESLSEESDEKIDAAIAAHPDDPAAQLVAIVRSAVATATAADYRGCPFQRATAEFPCDDHPANAVAIAHIETIRKRLRAIARQAGAASPAQLADRLMVLIDGVYAAGKLHGTRGPSHAAIGLAEDIVRLSTVA